MSKILIGSPVRQNKNILKEFLCGLEEADKGTNQISYYFVDDNTDSESTALLEKFANRNNVIIKTGSELYEVQDRYDGHIWQANTLDKIAVYKNTIISFCLENDFDYLFLIDSDIVIDKRALLQLLSDNVDIVSNVFWSQWGDKGPLTAQCFWIPDIYTQFKSFNVPITFQEAHKIRMDTYEQLKTPGLYIVNGLGACTLISKRALEMGVNFTKIPNLQIPGEDRPFCIRAGVLGIDLYMDTHYPAYHIHHERYLSRVDEFKKEGFKFDMCMTVEEPKKMKPFPRIRKFIVRIGNKLVRDFSD